MEVIGQNKLELSGGDRQNELARKEPWEKVSADRQIGIARQNI
ncbi:hypothetical protein [Robertmurraya sp. Marseille-Q9965]